jgi:hypothetical protein
VCLGSSLTVLKSYPLWGRKNHRPPLAIVNLQRTAKHAQAALAVQAPVDEVMCLLLPILGVALPAYDAAKDPVLQLPDTSDPAHSGLGWLGRGKAGGRSVSSTGALQAGEIGGKLQ